jgi:hypothetical protein
LYCLDSDLITEPLPVLTSSLPFAWYCWDSDLVYELSPVLDLSFAYPFWYNKYRSSTICLMCLHLGLALCPYTKRVFISIIRSCLHTTTVRGWH